MISVSICTYKTPVAELDNCLASLRHPLVKSVTIVDNAGEVRMREYAASHGVEYIALPNPGYGAAHNAVMLKSDCKYHLVVNADVYFDPEVLGKLAEVMDNNPDINQIQPAVIYADGTPQYCSRRLPSPLILFGRRFMPRLAEKANYRYLLKDKDLTKPLSVPYQTGCFMFIRTDAAKGIGGFDERFFMYPEDIDLSRRLALRGRVVYYPGCRIVHNHAADSYKSARMTRIHITNMLRYFAKWALRDISLGKSSTWRMNRNIAETEV